MTEVRSTKTQPYCDFPRQPYSIITDDFCHEKFLVIKPTLKTTRSLIKMKETVTYKKGAYSLAEELKLWFDLPRGGTLYTKFKSNDYIKLHYDDGRRQYQQSFFNLYFGLNTNKSLDLSAVKVGVSHDSKHCQSDNRLKIANDKGNHQYFFYNRTMVNHGSWTFGVLACFDICSKVLQKNNLLLGYKVNPTTDVFVRAHVDGFRTSNESLRHPESIFDKVTLDVVKQFNSETSGGLEVDYSIKHKNLDNVQAVVRIAKANKQLIKVGLNRYLDFSLLVKRPLDWLDGNATISAGVSVTGLTKNELGVKNGFEFGLNL